MDAEGLALQHLQHGGHKRFRDAVDLVEEQNPLPQAGLLHLFINRGDNFAHGVFRCAVLPARRRAIHDHRKTKCTLARVMRHGVGHKTDLQLLRDLAKDRCFADPRRPHEKDRPLLLARHAIAAVCCLCGIGQNRLPQLLFCLFYIHASSPFGFCACSTSFSAHGGRSMSS